MELASLAWTDATEYDGAVALLPVGSTEQHGPHAPLGTDCLTATAVATRASERATEPVIVAPTVPIGIAAEHRHFAGTLWVAPETFRRYVGDTVRSLAHHGWDRTIVVNGHGGNVNALREVCGRISRGEDAYAVPFTWFLAIDSEEVGMGHGGPIETAAVRALQPELVHEDRLDAAASDGSPAWGEWVSGTNVAYDTIEFSENGTVGDPRLTDATDGERYLDTAAEALVELIDAVESRPTGTDDRLPSESG